MALASDTPDPDATPTGRDEDGPAGGERTDPRLDLHGQHAADQHRDDQQPGEQHRGGLDPAGGPRTARYPASPYPGAPYSGAPYSGAPYPGSQYPGSPYPGTPYPGSQYPGSPFPGTPYAGQHAGGPYGRHTAPYDARAADAPRRGRGPLAAVAAIGLVTALLGGGVGGAVGYSVANGSGGSGGSSGVLGEPLPDVGTAAAPLGPVEAVAERVLPSVVQLRVEGGGASGEGSAMVLSADGLLLTNNHVVAAAASGGTVTAVFQDGATAPAQIVGRDPSSDLAVIRAQNVSGLRPIELGNSDSVRVGQQVVAFGSPLGLGGTVTAGIISALDRAVSVGEDAGANAPTVLNALQTDAAINPGNSGGPLVDMQGRVVGINSAIATTGAQGGSIGVGFAIPVNQAKRVAEELERTGKASRAILGVSVDNDPQQAGAIIRAVVPGGAAEQAGIRQGDVVLRFGDQRISTGTDLQAAVGSRAPGEVVDIELADRTVRARLAAAPG
jgi:putative serine protease PepD